MGRERESVMLTIGTVARKGGVSVETLRFYEREGLIPAPDRAANGYRLYASDAVARVRFIKRAQDVGFTHKDIKELLSLRADPRASCRDVRNRATRKLKDIEAKMAVLERMRSVLAAWVEECPSRGPVDECPIIDALESDEDA